MKATNWDKFKLLSWKNWLIQWRHKKRSIYETLIPLVATSFLLLIRWGIPPGQPIDTHYYKGLQTNDLSFFFDTYQRRPVMALAYAPQNPILDNLVHSASKLITNDENLQLTVLSNKTAGDLSGFLIANDIFVGIEFPNSYDKLTKLPEKLEFSLRFPSTLRCKDGESWKLGTKFADFTLNGPRNRGDPDGGIPPAYYREGFVAVQSALSQAFLLEKGGKAKEVYMQRYPNPEFQNDNFWAAMQGFIPLIIIVTLASPAVTLVKYVTLEKEQQLKETMKIMGLPSWLHWTSWFCKGFLQFTITVTLMTIMMKIYFPSQAAPSMSVCVLPNSNAFVIWLLFVIFSATTCCFCFMVSTFFSKPNIATTCFTIIWMFSYFGAVNINYFNLATSSKYLISLLSNSGIVFGLKIIAQYEFLGVGLQFSNLFTPSSIRDHFTVGSVMIMLIVDAILYMLIALYIEQIKPGEFGMPRPWYFPFMRSYWFPEGYKEMRSEEQTPHVSGRNFEADPHGHRSGIAVRNIVKRFEGKTAVNGLSLNMFEDQITVLLGHNGAGKTTTMSMLTGMIPPTSGTALLDGKDIRTNIEGVRESLGLCPQHNILFDELTVAEHIKFFAGLKGVRGESMQTELTTYLQMLEFGDKVNTPSKSLSGGMKRKLSVILALCGNSKIVLLDEPTSGMDPSARRALWDLLIDAKQGRTILLTTHFMDEADVLGDRIAIMSEGELKCVGSPFFLKKRYGVGYRLTCVKGPDCEPRKMTRLLSKHIPEIRVEEETKTEFDYVLNEKYSSKFKSIFKDVEEQSEICGVEGFGVSLTTMEEVFLKVGRDADMKTRDETDATDRVDTIHLESGVSDSYQHNVAGFSLFVNHFIATLLKKFYFNLHGWKLLLLMFVYPFIYMVFALIANVDFGFFGSAKPLVITPALYSGSVTVLQSDDASLSTAYEAIMGGVVRVNDSLQQYLLTEKPNSVISASITRENVTAFFDNEAYHSVPLTVSVLYNALLRNVCPTCSIEVVNAPIQQKTSKDPSNDDLGEIVDVAFGMSMGMIYAIFVPMFIIFYVKERVSRSKLLQVVSGIDTWAYWSASFLWDFMIFTLFTLIFLGSVLVRQKDYWSDGVVLMDLFVLLTIFAWAVLPMIYMASFIFRVPSTGVTVLLFFCLIAGVIPGQIMAVFDLIPDIKDNKYYILANTVLLIIPHFSLIKAVSNLGFLGSKKLVFEKLCMQVPGCTLRNICTPNYFPQYCEQPGTFQWTPPGCGQSILALAVVGLFWFTLLFLKEYHIIKFKIPWRRHAPVEYAMDEDVAAERDRVYAMNESQLKDHNIVVKDATKWYKNFLAVKKVCLTIDQGECFGLLGANGAGKTSIFKMLTGEVGISSGDAWIQGINLKSGLHNVNKRMSYCPQFDALLDDLTGRETLRIFCLIRGIHSKDIARITNQLSEELHFTKHLDKPTRAWSGGNKRKLSTALAVLTNPPVIFLDEPTSGLDPGAKRKLWDNVTKVREMGSSIVLTSHSMEECEALCTRLAIMVNGEFKCLGSTQHLKNRFSKGYLLLIKMTKELTENEVERIKDFIVTSFEGATLKEQHSDMLSYNLDRTDLLWSEMFGRMEDNKIELKIEDYSLGQNSLEQVFLYFTKYQKETVDPALRNKTGN